ncbi:MAG: Asp-tRNA(Asn)/Glu-tRNA(Gln) amidotransferase subunit GatC [Planctomycetia bacterium]
MSAQPAIDLPRLAELARLSLSSEEQAALLPQLERILAQLAELERVPLDDTPAMVRAREQGSVLRSDEPQPSLPREALLLRAPQAEEPFYSVPKTVGGEG